MDGEKYIERERDTRKTHTKTKPKYRGKLWPFFKSLIFDVFGDCHKKMIHARPRQLNASSVNSNSLQTYLFSLCLDPENPENQSPASQLIVFDLQGNQNGQMQALATQCYQ